MVSVTGARPPWELEALGDTPPVGRECQNTAGVLLLQGRKKRNFLECKELSSNAIQAEMDQECLLLRSLPAGEQEGADSCGHLKCSFTEDCSGPFLLARALRGSRS